MRALGALAILAISCDVSFMLPSGPAFPTAAPGVVETIVAGTAGAAQSQTAVLLPPTVTPTFTITPTRTPTVTPTLTPTFIFVLRSATPVRTATSASVSGSGALACRLLDQDPEDGAQFEPNEHFDAVWNVRNIGTSDWDKTNVDFIYESGRKMYESPIYDLRENVDEGEDVDLIVDMIAPKADGTHKTTWTLRRGGTEFCHVDITIVVK